MNPVCATRAAGPARAYFILVSRAACATRAARPARAFDILVSRAARPHMGISFWYHVLHAPHVLLSFWYQILLPSSLKRQQATPKFYLSL